MTPEQAQTKRCCGPEGCGEERSNSANVLVPAFTRKCIGPDCMAWRWNEPLRTTEKTWTYFLGGKPSLYQRQEYDAVTETTATVLVEVKTGYCGLAGKEGAQ